MEHHVKFMVNIMTIMDHHLRVYGDDQGPSSIKNHHFRVYCDHQCFREHEVHICSKELHVYGSSVDVSSTEVCSPMTDQILIWAAAVL